MRIDHQGAFSAFDQKTLSILLLLSEIIINRLFCPEQVDERQQFDRKVSFF